SPGARAADGLVFRVGLRVTGRGVDRTRRNRNRRRDSTHMALRGDLASVDLAQVFQMLALNKKVGLLSIQSAKLWKVLYFEQRGVTLYHNVHQVLDRVVAAFVRSGRLTEAIVD